jgi:hypothetical protein
VSGTATALDHLGIVVRDLAAARAAWEAAGFAPTPGGRIMLRHFYIELLAQDPIKPSATLTAMLARGEGAHVLSLRVADADEAAARLRQAGFDAAIIENERPSEERGGDAGGTARFRRVPLTDALPRLQLIEHLTPEIVWHQALLAQPNGAASLAEIVVVADPPAEFAARLSRVAGRGLAPAPADGGFLLKLDHGAVRVLGQDAFRRLWPGATPPAGTPRLAALVLRGTTPAHRHFPGLDLRIIAPDATAPG